MSIRIIIDSAADMPRQSKENYTIVPLTVRFGDQAYLDDVELDQETFYTRLQDSRELPATSQPSPDAFAQIFAQVAAAGEQAVVITLASELSGTWQSAMIAAQDYSGRIFVVDSKTAATGIGILAERARQLADAGMAAAQIAQTLEQERQQLRLVAVLDTLEYLKRGGRISKTVAFAGSLLSIKPVVSVRDGVIQLIDKARGQRQGYRCLTRQVQAQGGIDFDKPVLLGYTGLDGSGVQAYWEDSRQLWGERRIPVAAIGSVIGTHAGPGALAVAFFSKDQRGSDDREGTL